MNTLPLSPSFLLKTCTHGPFYGLVHTRIQRAEPLDPEENWNFWTKPRSSLLTKALQAYPPTFLRKILINKKLLLDHGVGITEHYDVSNEFYKLFLDSKYMFYSCADFNRGDETLEEAQENKANFILNLIEPHAGERILDLGCGWGAMLRRLYEATGDKENLSGYTLSKEQVAYIREHYGFNVSHTDFINASYQAESFDKIYSIGAWEHVRPSEIPTLLEKLYRALKPGGRLVQHFFCLSREELPTTMLLVQLFFPGSVLATYQYQIEACQRAGFRLTHETEHDYRPTLKAWYYNLVANKDKAIKLVGVKTYNKYLVFFPLSWKFFDEGQACVRRFALEKPRLA